MRFTPLYVLLLGVVFFSCKKPVLDDNGTLPANSLNVLFTDTLTIKSTTVKMDSVRGENQAVSILGSMDEPVFGKSFASIYTQFALPVSNLSLGTNLTVDSVVLTVKYLGTYGNTNVPMNIRVYRNAQRFYVDSLYYTNQTFAIQPNLLGVLNNYKPNLTDSVFNHYKDDTLGHSPSMKIRLDNSLGADLLAQSGSSNVVDNEAFLNYFNGLYITTDTTRPGAGVVYVDMRSTDTQLRVYYKGDNVDSLITFYVTSSAAQTVNHYQHNYANSSVANVLGNNNVNGDSMVFCQAMAGVKAKIQVPYITNLGKIAISKAELMFTAISDGSQYATPLQITANGITPAGLDTILQDQLIGSTYFGGYELNETVGSATMSRYRIDLASYYQGLVQGKTDYGIYAYPTPSQRIADRIVFGGGTHSKYKVKLNLTYTKIQ